MSTREHRSSAESDGQRTPVLAVFTLTNRTSKRQRALLSFGALIMTATGAARCRQVYLPTIAKRSRACAEGRATSPMAIADMWPSWRPQTLTSTSWSQAAGDTSSQ